MLLLGDIGLDNVRRLQTIHSGASLGPFSLRPFAVSVGNGLNIALHSRTLKSRNDRTKPNEGGTNERARPRGRRRRRRSALRPSVRPSFPPPPPPPAVCLVERGEKRKSEIGYGRHRLRNVGSSTSAERVPDSTGIFLTWSSFWRLLQRIFFYSYIHFNSVPSLRV